MCVFNLYSFNNNVINHVCVGFSGLVWLDTVYDINRSRVASIAALCLPMWLGNRMPILWEISPKSSGLFGALHGLLPDVEYVYEVFIVAGALHSQVQNLSSGHQRINLHM